MYPGSLVRSGDAAKLSGFCCCRRSLIAFTLTLPYGCVSDSPRPSETVHLDTIAAISFRGLPVPRPSSPVAVSGDLTSIAVALKDGSGEIFVFDRNGELKRRFGRAGQGPGEFRDIAVLTFSPGSDSLWVLDEGNQRISVLDPESSEVFREIHLKGRFFGGAWASDTLLVVQGQFDDDSPAALARALHPGGVDQISFDHEVLILDDIGAYMRPLTSSAGGGIWIGNFRQPELRKLDSNLREVDRLAYRADMLETAPANAELWADYIDTRPAVLDVTEDAEGRIWMLFGVPADPLPAVEDPGRALAEGRIGAADLANTVLARYDTESLSSGPTFQIDQGPLRGGLLPRGLAYSFEADEMGEITLILIRLS